MSDKPKVIFLASFPPILSAIKVDGSGGMRITLDIPESEIAEAVKLMLYRQVPLRVTIEPHEQEKSKAITTTTGDNNAGNSAPKRTAAKRRIG